MNRRAKAFCAVPLLRFHMFCTKHSECQHQCCIVYVFLLTIKLQD